MMKNWESLLVKVTSTVGGGILRWRPHQLKAGQVDRVYTLHQIAPSTICFYSLRSPAFQNWANERTIVDSRTIKWTPTSKTFSCWELDCSFVRSPNNYVQDLAARYNTIQPESTPEKLPLQKQLQLVDHPEECPILMFQRKILRLIPSQNLVVEKFVT